jgi:hypothetical protein
MGRLNVIPLLRAAWRIGDEAAEKLGKKSDGGREITPSEWSEIRVAAELAFGQALERMLGRGAR